MIHNEVEQLKKQIAELTATVNALFAYVKNSASCPASKTNCKYTLYSWLDEWHRVYKKPSVKPSTLYTLDVLIRIHIKPSLPDMPLNLLTGLDLQRFLTAMPPSRTRKAVFDLLKESLKTAYDLKLISDNPAQAVKLPPHVQEKGEALTSEELEAFLTAIKKHPLKNYFLFLLYTGCRRSEGLSMRAADIDRKKGLLHVRGTKTEKSDRTLPLFENVAALLDRLKPKKDGFYFPFRADYPTHAFKKLCPAHKLHDLRHTFATRCLEAKIPLKVVQIWLGHSKLDTTADIYSHVSEELNRSEAAVLNQYLTAK